MRRSAARTCCGVVVLGAAVVAAPMAVALEGSSASPAKVATADDAPPAGPPGANPLWGIGLKQLSGTRERPLFSPSRRPPPPPAPPPVAVAPPVEKPKEPERPQLALLGTVVNHDESYGIFMDQTVSSPVRIRLGSSHRGWTLRKITVNAVAPEKEGQTADIAFPKKRGEPELKKQVVGGLLAAAGATLRGALEKVEGSSPPPAGDQPPAQGGLRLLKNPFAAQQASPPAQAPAQAN